MANGQGGAFPIPSLAPIVDKRAARFAARARRDQLDRSPDRAFQLRDRLLGEVPLPKGAVIAGYWPIGSEFDILPTLSALAARGFEVALPVVGERGMALAFHAWREGGAMRIGGYGVAEPKGTPEVVPGVVLAPLLAFDRRGHRLGYGAGCYDRALAGLRAGNGVLAVGVAFAAQEVASVPTDDHDQPLDWIVTEREAFPFG